MLSLCRPPVESIMGLGRFCPAVTSNSWELCQQLLHLASDLFHIFPQDLREKNWKAMEAMASAERAFEEKLHSLTEAKVRIRSSDLPASQDSISSTCVV